MNVARKTLEILNAFGWIKGSARSHDGYCAIGAMTVAMGSWRCGVNGPQKLPSPFNKEVEYVKAAERVRGIIKEQFPDRCFGWPAIEFQPIRFVAAFNDHPDTTFDDVRMVLEKTAIKLDEEV